MTKSTIPAQDQLKIFTAVFLVWIIYQFSYSQIPASDGYTWIQNIDRKIWQKIFLPNHLLSEFFIILIKKILHLFQIKIPTLSLIQFINSILSAASCFIFYWYERRFGFSHHRALAGMMLFAGSFSLWFFANGEIHHLGLFLLLLVFAFLMRFREKPSLNLAIAIAYTHALASGFHQEHFLFFVPITWMMLAGRFRKSNFSYYLIYLLMYSVITIGLYGSVAQIVYRAQNLEDLRKWFFMFTYSDSQTVNVMLSGGENLILKQIKGFLMSINYGAQILVDYLRYSSVRANLRANLFLLASLIGIVGILALLISSIGFIRGLKGEKRIVGLGFFIWFFVYELFIYVMKLSPESPEYHLVSLPAFLFLVLITGFAKKEKKVPLLITVVVAFTLLVNLCAAIYPWKLYGSLVSEFETFAQKNFSSADFFISTESGLDPVIRKKWNYLSIKDLAMSSRREETLHKIKSAIDENLSEGKRVFVYNLIPGDYALKAIRHYQTNGVTKNDMANLSQELRADYSFEPIFQYWEINYSQIYLFDPKSDTVWQLKPKTT